MHAEVSFEDGRTGSITCSLFSATLFRIGVRVEGELGTMEAFNPVAPQFYHHLAIETRSGKRRERVDHVPSYTYQLRAFASAERVDLTRDAVHPRIEPVARRGGGAVHRGQLDLGIQVHGAGDGESSEPPGRPG